MILELNGIDVECIIGERADERTRTQRLLVDVRLEIGDAAAESDALSDTVDYAALTEKVRAVLVAAKCRMIERAAKVVCDLCREDPKFLREDFKKREGFKHSVRRAGELGLYRQTYCGCEFSKRTSREELT